MANMAGKFQHTTLTHRVLWECVQCQLDQARASEEGSWYFYLTAMFMGYMVFEAYINYIGHMLDPDVWQDERQRFRGTGTTGKLDHLVVKFELELDKGARPFTSLKALKSLRDAVAHARPDTQEAEVSGLYDFPSGLQWLDGQVSEEQASMALGDVDLLIEQLHQCFVRADQDGVLPSFALKGALASGFGAIALR